MYPDHFHTSSPAYTLTSMLPQAWLRLLFRVIALLMVIPSMLQAAPADHVGAWPQGLIANVGQWPSHVLFLSRQAGTDVWITRKGVEIDRYSITVSGQLREGTVARQSYVDANPAARITTSRELYRINVFRGDNAGRQFSVPVYSSVHIGDFLPGVDVQFRSSDSGLYHELVPEPGVNIAAFRVVNDGHESVRAFSAPRSKMLYESYLGGAGSDHPAGMVRMRNGDVVVAGTTEAMTYDVRLGRYSKSINGNKDGFLVRLNATLRQVVSYTFVGGEGNDRITDLVVSCDDDIYITGETESHDLPVTATASSKTYAMQTDAFVAGFAGDLEKILFCTYHGGFGEDRPVSIALDATGNVCVLGNTTSARMPTTFPATTSGVGGGIAYGNADMFIACFSRSGFLQRGRFVGSSGDDVAAAMVFDASNSIFIIGSTTMPSFAASAKGRFSGGKTDAFIMKFDAHLNTRPGESRLFGGSGDEHPVDATIDNLGRIVVVGNTTSKDFPTLGEVGVVAMGGQDVFFTVFAKDGHSIRQSGCIGGSRSDSVVRVITEPKTASMIMLGQTESVDFPVSEGDAAAERSGETDGFIVRVDGNRIASSQLIGGDGSDAIVDGWVDSLDRVVFLASTTSSDINATYSSVNGHPDGSGILIGRCVEGAINLYMPAGGETYCSGMMMPVRWTATAIADTVRFTIAIARVASDTWTVVASGIAGNSTYMKVPALPAGDYLLRVSTLRGHVTQLTTPFSITELPQITVQPQSIDICGGESAELSVEATGRGLTYQWRRNGHAIAGATSSTLVVGTAEIDQTARFDCQITNPCGVRIESASAEVRLGQPPVISVQPARQTITPGAAFTLSVVAEGADLTYRWWHNGMLLPDQESAILRVSSATSADQGWYVCSVTGSCGTRMSDSVMVRMLTTSVGDRPEATTMLRPLTIDGDNDNVWLRLTLDAVTPAQVRLVDISGRTVSELPFATFDRGTHDLRLPTGGCSSGLYNAVVVTDRIVCSAPVIVKR